MNKLVKAIIVFLVTKIGFSVVNDLAIRVFSPLNLNDYLYEFLLEASMALFVVICLAVLKKLDVLKFRFSGWGVGLAVGAYPLIKNILFPLFGYAAAQVTGYGDYAAPITATFGEIVLFVLFALMIGVAEEGLYRGIVQNVVLDWTGRDTAANVQKGIVISGILFGLIHLTNLMGDESFSAVMLQVISAIPIGILYGAIYFRSKDNLWISIIIHALTDGVALLVIGRLNGVEFVEGLDNIGAAKTSNPIASIGLLVLSVVIALFVIRKKVITKAIEARKAA